MPRLFKYLDAALSAQQNQKSKIISPLKPGTPCTYSGNAELEFSKNKEGLANWLSNPHDEYNMASLDFYGHLIDDSGNITGFSSMIQQQFGLPLTENIEKDLMALPYLAEFSICNEKSEGVVIAPFMLEKKNVSFKADPFSETATLDFLIVDEKISIKLTSGVMGQPGAKYLLQGKAYTFDKALWEYNVVLTDTMGTIAVGYGPQSFLPQWLTTEQKNLIDAKPYSGNVHAYIKKSNDNMQGEGSYYYSLPLLQVDHFKIYRNKDLYTTGSKGYMWVDYVTQSFSHESFPVLKSNATWQFLAIQLPPELNPEGPSGALMFSKVKMKIPKEGNIYSVLPMARFYQQQGSPQPNSALNPTHEWNIKEITFSPANYWPEPEPKAAPNFPLAFSLTLGSIGTKGYAKLDGKAVYKNQVAKAVDKYEGVFEITGVINLDGSGDKPIKGYAWAEIH